MKAPDIAIVNLGGMGFFQIASNTRRGNRWLRQNVQGVEVQEYSYRGKTHTDVLPVYCDDSRYAQDIYQGAIEDGLRVEVSN